MAAIVFFGYRSADSARPPLIEIMSDSDAESFESWEGGPFTPLAGRNIRADLDRHLMLLKADLEPEAEEALRAKLAAFLRAYSGTDFTRYLDFRPPESMCTLADPRLQPTIAAWSPQLGPVPTDAAGLVASAWRLYVEEGWGPVRPGPIIDAVKWPSCRATIHRLSKREIIPGEWDETAPGEGLLAKAAANTRASRGPYIVVRPAVPNAISVAELAKRDGAVICADFDVVCRATDSAPQRLVLRFVWDAAAHTWLPLHALVYGGDMVKPFIW